MIKYIDADRLNADLDKWVKAMADAEVDYSDGVRFATQHFIFLLASLQQEQPEVELEKEIEEYWSTMGWNKVVELRKFKPIARYFYGLRQLNSK